MKNQNKFKPVPPLMNASLRPLRWLRHWLLAILALAFGASAFATVAPQMFGVNLSGGEFGSAVPGTYGTDYIYPSQAEFDYYQARNITLVRVPFRWERIQHSLNATLDATEMARLDAVITCARNNGMQVILDMHNYNNYKISGTNYQVGSAQVPYTAFQNVWGQLANRYKNETAVYGYDLMNEPQGTLANWQSAAQGAVTIIRTHDTQHWVIVEGVAWAGAQSWNTYNSTLSVTDSADRLIYSAHSYWDANHDGVYGSYAAEGGTPTKGRDDAKPFVDWIKAHNYNGYIGEYGVPYNTDSASWNVVLDDFLSYAQSNGLSGTYWAGGPWWGDTYALGCEPYPLTDPDKPQMSILENYGSSPSRYEVESIAVATATDTVNSLAEAGLSNGHGELLASNAVNDSISYTLPNVPAGSYSVRVGVKMHSSLRGKFQLSIDGVNQGAVQDECNPSVVYAELDLGVKTFSTTANRTFKFTVTGKNASSTSYSLAFDYIQLVHSNSPMYEVESIAVATATDTVNSLAEAGLSAGHGELLASNAVNDYISYTLPNVPAGTYTVLVGVKMHSSLRGKFQLSIDGTNQGAVQDECNPSLVYTELNLGSKTFGATGDRAFKFTVTGKNTSSTSYNLAFDYIKLVP